MRMETMNRAKTVLLLPMLTLLALLATPIAAQAWERGKVERFATLPAGEAHPEGIAWTARATSTSSPWQRTNRTRVGEH